MLDGLLNNIYPQEINVLDKFNKNKQGMINGLLNVADNNQQPKPNPLPVPNIPAFHDKHIRDLTPEEMQTIMRNLHGFNNQGMNPQFLLADSNYSRNPDSIQVFGKGEDSHWEKPPQTHYSTRSINGDDLPGTAWLIDPDQLMDSPNANNSPFYSLI